MNVYFLPLPSPSLQSHFNPFHANLSVLRNEVQNWVTLQLILPILRVDGRFSCPKELVI